MAISQYETCYKRNNPFSGKLIIIDNEEFYDLPKRLGTEKDAERLQTTFEQLGFEVAKHKNLKSGQMLIEFVKVKDMIVKDPIACDCLAIAILSHGEDNGIIHGVGSKDGIPLDHLLAPLKEIKNGKPKLVFVQACRGNDLDEGQTVQNDSPYDNRPNTETNFIRVPLDSDFLYHFSSSPGKFSFRNSTRGSVFIQTLCNVIDEYIKKDMEIDLLKALTQVNGKVAEDYESYVTNPKMLQFHQKKQMPSIVSMLRKDVFLRKKP